jgi:cytochrome c biogenesis protein CcdA
MTCPQCHEPVPPHDSGRFCSHCGSALAPAAQGNVSTRTAEPSRFALARRSPDFDHAMEDLPVVSAAGRVFWALLFVAGSLGVFGYCLFLARMLSATAPSKKDELVIELVTVGLPLGSGLLLAFAARYLSRQLRFMTAPVESRLALIADERTEVNTHHQSGGRSHSSTSYFAAVEDESGERQELACGSEVAGSIAPGDVGVAYVKHDELVGFRRLRGG